ncbi:putative secreted protein (Por secretion system target) [Chryseobacterium sp. 52]|uniref:M1 family aminopeptidase n=1 Tax=Chryseobacterium sp. 52 TaxID=2035213 RepID=UPI000C19262E|nr:M1 family aminopeptidase [Chryseobacterium sp. 52]PIF47648.1 putative secreted protein (Por secretion system target) [Chryseobacterium sp. 52]
MKTPITYILLIIFPFSIAFSQERKRDIDIISKKEKKSALSAHKFQFNPNTANYDVTYHKIELKVNPAVQSISGKVTTNYTALSNMNTVTFDLVNQMVVSSVKQNNVSLSFIQNTNKELVITLPNTQLAGTSASVEITYAGTPPNTGHVFFTTHSNSPIFYTLSESFGDREWWPCKQDMRDKIASIDLYITAPSQYVAVGNGVETTTPVISGANKTTHFYHNYPIPAYLVSVAVANYSTFNQTGGTAPNTYPIVNYVFPEHLSLAQNNLSAIPSFLNFYESLLGTYPYSNEKYGNAEVTYSGMEHPTVSFISNYDRYMMEHEMAHQWFGDKITCATWNDIWLNEGFATFMDQLLIENYDGNTAGISNRTYMINNITSQSNGAVYLTDAEALDEDRIFDPRLSYNKGAMVLNMLRLKMGETSFLLGLKNYINDPNLIYKTAETPDFKAHMEAVYGSSLTDFFNDWIYNQGYPIYTIKAQNIGAGQAKVLVSQTQSHASVNYFEMRLPLQFTGAGGQVYNTYVNNTVNNEYFTINVPFTITGVRFDPEKHIISRNNTATLGVDNVDFEKDKIEIYPNPVSTILTVDYTASIDKATITNMAGQEMAVHFINKNQIDFSKFSPGVYVLQLHTQNGTKTIKIVKK